MRIKLFVMVSVLFLVMALTFLHGLDESSDYRYRIQTTGSDIIPVLFNTFGNWKSSDIRNGKEPEDVAIVKASIAFEITYDNKLKVKYGFSLNENENDRTITREYEYSITGAKLAAIDCKRFYSLTARTESRTTRGYFARDQWADLDCGVKYACIPPFIEYIADNKNTGFAGVINVPVRVITEYN